MEAAHKQRLVGGIVLVALLLILVPTILDFSQETQDPLQQQEMPEAPDAMKMEVLPLEVWSEKVDPEVDGNNRVLEEPAPAAKVEPGPTPVEQSEPPVVAPSAKAPPKAVAKSERPAKPVIPAGATAWAVQIASFTDEPKAFALRDKLRKAGHAAFIERGVSGGQTIYRVKAGPVLQRSEADELQAQIAKETSLKGLVMQYR